MSKILLLLVIALAIGAFAGFQWMAAPSPTARGNAPQAIAGTPVPTAPADAGDVVVEVDEATLSREMNASLAGQTLGNTPLGPATAREMAVELRNSRLVANGTALVGGATVPVQMIGTADVQNGRAVVTVREATVGGVPLPDSMRLRAQEAVQQQVDRALKADSVRVKSLTIDDGRLRVVASPS